ncbi:MAG: NTP transferase domain-containing protein [Hyphomicrobiales bacterium]|nr:NTP transferase domain-containing protein [Hyphomicrobiales bacterium]
MKFASLAVAKAAGGILVHSIAVGGLTLRKGGRLTDKQAAGLAAAGVEAVTVAVLEPGDVDEDTAAVRVAEAVLGEGVQGEAAHTGRVNLTAAFTGCLDYDPVAVDALNAVDEDLTMAVRPRGAWVHAGELVATVKTIPYGVPGDLLDRVIAAAPAAALRVEAARDLAVALVQTALPGTRAGLLDKMAEVTAARLDDLGATLAAEHRCDHTRDALAAGIAAAADSGFGFRPDLILIAGANSVADRRDVVPAAIEAAGGQVLRLGMPVDPGNLLVLADLDGVPVVGVPGCARSPKLNGFDWVLRRLVCGLPVDSAAIAAMGAGGLLKEISERPQPRRDRGPAAAPPRLAALVLAAGSSRRMGAVNKLLAQVGGVPMVRRVLDAVPADAVAETVVVTGHQAGEVARAVAGRDLRLVHNPDFEMGMGGSLARGVAALGDDVDGVLVLLGDMPGLSADAVRRVLDAFDPAGGGEICLPVWQGRRGHPVLFGRRFFPELAALSGDMGGKALLDAFDTRIVEVAVDDGGVIDDVDTPEQLAAAVSR